MHYVRYIFKLKLKKLFYHKNVRGTVVKPQIFLKSPNKALNFV